MRFNHHSPYHWIVVVLVAVVSLFTFGHARGQGGIGVQGNEAAQWLLTPRKPAGVDSRPTAPSAVRLVPRKDDVARDLRSPTRRVKKAARRTLDRSRTGVGGIDAVANAPR